MSLTRFPECTGDEICDDGRISVCSRPTLMRSTDSLKGRQNHLILDCHTPVSFACINQIFRIKYSASKDFLESEYETYFVIAAVCASVFSSGVV